MVSDRTLSVDVWNEVRTKLVAASLAVTDGTSVTSASIRASYNDREPKRPQVIIEPVAIDEANWKFGSNQGKKLININIDSYYKNSLGVDQLFDQVKYTLKDEEIDGVELVAISSDYSFAEIGENKFHLKSATFSYDRE